MDRSLFWLFAAGIAVSACGPQSPNSRLQSVEEALRDDHAAEASYKPHYLHLATGTAETAKNLETKHPWPQRVLSIGHNTASFQHYGGNPYFHHGLDIRGDAGSDVIASAGGKVVNIENYMPPQDAYWEVAILDDDGFLWQYHHVERDSIPQEIHDAYKSGEKITAGTKIGEIFYWSVTTFGERYHHVHLNVLGAGGIYLNPFNFLEPLADTQAPQVVELGLLKNGNRWQESSISGSYSAYAIIHDLILHDKFVVPPHEITYTLDNEAPVVVWNFDTLPGGTSNERFVRQFFVPGIACGDYSCRRLAVNLGFHKDGNRALTQTPGQHKLVLTARDVVGNSVSKDLVWTVK